jgi:hypothetical protein
MIAPAAGSLPWRNAVDLVSPEERDILWRSGQLFWLLHGDQADAYRRYRDWERDPFGRKGGLYKLLWVFDCGRRWGKDWLCLVIKLEDAIRRPGSEITYATAFAKDINEIVIPLMRQILATCPDDIAPAYRTTRMGEANGYYFPNGSVIKLVGIDKNPDGARGRGSDGAVITEAGFVSKLEQIVASVIYPQFQGRERWARFILQSTAPESIRHPYDRVFLRDAKLRNAWCFRTIEDNPMLDDEQRQHFIDAAGGRDHPRARREYFGERIRDPSDALVPEFDATRHVKPVPRIEWADTYTSLDPGIRDQCGIVWAYYDAVRDKLCVQRSWSESGLAAGTPEVARVVLTTEADLWSGTRWWDGSRIQPAPYARVSDTDLRLLADLSNVHKIHIQPADKTDSKEASLLALREWFYDDRIEIDPEGGALLIEHLVEGKWNAKRTDYLRDGIHGHFDLVDALRYLVRRVQRGRIARPPEYVLNPSLQREMFKPPTRDPMVETMNATIGKKQPWNNAHRRTWGR